MTTVTTGLTVPRRSKRKRRGKPRPCAWRPGWKSSGRLRLRLRDDDAQHGGRSSVGTAQDIEAILLRARTAPSRSQLRGFASKQPAHEPS
jgi:hypothetical protein